MAGSATPKPQGWHFLDENGSGKAWARASSSARPIVHTSFDISIDFFSDNFDVKHLIVVGSAQKFDNLLASGASRQASRKKGFLADHHGGKVSKSSVNTTIVVTLDMLAIWGADIARQFKLIETKPTGKFKGINQWTVTSTLKNALCMTHSNSPTDAGMGAFVSVTLEKSASKGSSQRILYVTHLHSAGFDGNRNLFLKGGNKISPEDIQDAKRQIRFNKQFTEVDYSGVGSLFG